MKENETQFHDLIKLCWQISGVKTTTSDKAVEQAKELTERIIKSKEEEK